jgi:lipoic acid synthetase
MHDLEPPKTILKKPAWLRIKAPCSTRVLALKDLLRQYQLNTVCENAACPNIAECFHQGTATFLIMGNTCTRNCAFCNIDHGKPEPLDSNEPNNLATITNALGLNYVVLTSVTRDDLADGGASHFVNCLLAIRQNCPTTKIEILVPDFQRCQQTALAAFQLSQPDVFNHNLETVPRLYKTIRTGANYQGSLTLLKEFKHSYPTILTKSGLMLGLGETLAEIKAVINDLKEHTCDLLTLGQYLQPKPTNVPVARYVPPEEFAELNEYAKKLGFKNVASGPLVRSSYHAAQLA